MERMISCDVEAFYGKLPPIRCSRSLSLLISVTNPSRMLELHYDKRAGGRYQRANGSRSAGQTWDTVHQDQDRYTT